VLALLVGSGLITPFIGVIGVVLNLGLGMGDLGTGLRIIGVGVAHWESPSCEGVDAGMGDKGGGDKGGDNKRGEHKCDGGGDIIWLGVVFPDAKNMSEPGVLPLADDAIE